MKNYLLVMILIFLVINPLFSQTKPKPKQKESMSKQKETAPTQKEMEEMMKEAQKEMENLDPETKHMMDSMGIQMPSFNSIPQVTDAQLKEAFENESRIVPVKDAARIASISITPLTNALLPAFIFATHNKVDAQLKPASQKKGEELYQSVKIQYNSPAATGNAAAGLWMMGKAELALYVMGKACIDAPTNTDNLNNYASMLSMSGAENLALPMLNYVNERFPKNSTVLNNIGQAWFGLGDIDEASKYLDEAIKLYPLHSQANYTKSFIEESKGNTTAAVAAAKRSIKKAYSQTKDDRLKKLDHKLTGDDLDWNHPMPQDPLGLEKFKWPAYPNSVTESEALENEWKIFKDMCKQELNKLKANQKKLEEAMLAGTQKRMTQLMQAGQKGLQINPLPPLAYKASIKLKYLVDGKDGHLALTYQRKGEALAKAYLETVPMEEKLSAQLAAIQKKYEDEFGEGKPNPFGKVCREENAALDIFLGSSNGVLQRASTDWLEFLRKKTNDEVYYNQYIQWPDEFEMTKGSAKIMWLTAISDQKVNFRSKSSSCQEKTNQKDKPFELAHFDDKHCMYHSSFTTPVGSMKMDCSRWTTELDLKVVKLGLKQDMDRETFGDQFMSCSVEVGVGASAGINTGPLKAEASIGGGIAAEFDRNGLTDITVKTSAGVSAGTDIISGGSMAGAGVSDLSVDVGVKGQVSLISGKSSIESTGLLAGAFRK